MAEPVPTDLKDRSDDQLVAIIRAQLVNLTTLIGEADRRGMEVEFSIKKNEKGRIALVGERIVKNLI